MDLSAVAAVALGVFLAVVGVSHFLVPRYYRSLVPPWLPSPGLAVAVSGIVEIVLGVALVVPATRPVGAWAAAALMAVYVAGHLEAARRASASSPRLLERPVGIVLRVVANVGYLGWALAVALTL